MLVETGESQFVLGRTIFDFMQQRMDRIVARARHGDPLTGTEQVANYLRADRALATAGRSLNEQVAAIERLDDRGHGRRRNNIRLESSRAVGNTRCGVG